MPRKNLAGDWSGESQRLTVRLSVRERVALRELCAAWAAEPSEVLRRALRESAAAEDLREREAMLEQVPVLGVAGLRTLATELAITGRGRMIRSELRAAIVARLERGRLHR